MLDVNQSLLASSVSVPTPTGTPTPQPGSVYFGSFIGGADANDRLVRPRLPHRRARHSSRARASTATMTLERRASGTSQLPALRSRTARSSSTPTSTWTPAPSARSAPPTSSSPAPSSTPRPTTPLRRPSRPATSSMGLMRQAQMGTVLKYVFVPEDDSVVIGGTRYMLSVINLEGLDDDPNSRPYPPVYWPQIQYWQFANRHNPYLDVALHRRDRSLPASARRRRTSRASASSTCTGAGTDADVPRHQPGEMTVWPIFAFPYDDRRPRAWTRANSRSSPPPSSRFSAPPSQPPVATSDRAARRRADLAARPAAAEQSLHGRHGDDRRRQPPSPPP